MFPTFHRSIDVFQLPDGTFNRGILPPKRDAFHVLFFVELDSGTASLFTKAVSHGSDRLHWELRVNILSLDRDNSIVILNIFFRISSTCCLSFGDALCLAVKDDVEVLGLL